MISDPFPPGVHVKVSGQTPNWDFWSLEAAGAALVPKPCSWEPTASGFSPGRRGDGTWFPVNTEEKAHTWRSQRQKSLGMKSLGLKADRSEFKS